jgi:hypothetical protein
MDSGFPRTGKYLRGRKIVVYYKMFAFIKRTVNIFAYMQSGICVSDC